MSRQRNRPSAVQTAAAAAAVGRRQYKRGRLGRPGVEPFDQRGRCRPMAAQLLALAGAFVAGAGATAVGAVLAAGALALGVPGAWARTNDRPSCSIWTVAVVAFLAGVVLSLTGASGTVTSSHPGAGPLLITAAPLIALLSFFRRWGTGGNTFSDGRRKIRGGYDEESRRMLLDDAQRRGLVDKYRDD